MAGPIINSPVAKPRLDVPPGLLTMFNGYNETPLISYNDFNQERGEKKQENVPKWSYGHDAGGQPTQPHSNSRHAEFWSGKPNFLGISNVLKCSCAGCYPCSENQSYQGDSTRHRPWLPRAFSVPLNGSNEPCKLPTYQWDNGLSKQGPCYPEGNLPYVQESGGRYAYYRHCQNPRLPEPNQPGVITSVKNGDYAKKLKNEMPSLVQNGVRQPVLCSPAYNLSKRIDGRNYCDPNEKYSNVASYSVGQQVARLPVVEPFIKAVPSNLSQNRVPSTGYRSIKENMPQQYVTSVYSEARKITEQAVNGDKRCEAFPAPQLQSGLHLDYSYLNRDLPEMESQKLFFDNTRQPDYVSKNSFHDVIKRNSHTLGSRKECATDQMGISQQHYNMSRSKYQEAVISKPSCEVFYPRDFEKSRQGNHSAEDSTCFQRNEDGKTENSNVHIRFSRSAFLFNDPHFAEGTENSLPCQGGQVAYGNYLRSEYQGYNAQMRHKYPSDFDTLNQYRATAQELQSCEQMTPQQSSGFIYDVQCQKNVDKTQQFYGEKNQSSVQPDSQPSENRKPTYLEAVRSEEINKNGTNKISPLRLLRKKKFINVPQEPATVSTFDATNPGLDVRKFWSTWAEEEEENLAPTQVVVLDCQNIDPEQAKLLHLYEPDSVRTVHLESGSVVMKSTVKEPVNQTSEDIKAIGQSAGEREVEEEANPKKEKEVCMPEGGEPEKADEGNLKSYESGKRSEIESICQKASPNTPVRKEKSQQENRGKKKTEIMDRWTEKKFDFIKRAEESKAAEVLRHQEEKKKIFETKLSLQQSLENMEKCHAETEECAPQTTSPFAENCQSDSPESGNALGSDLPTSEYRRNKFLDFSDRKLIMNRKDEAERGEKSEKADKSMEADEVKKEENPQSGSLSNWMDRHGTEKLPPTLKAKLKEEPTFEMDHIMKKMSEINFQNGETKNGLEIDAMKKTRGPPTRRLKKKELDHQAENEDKADKLMVETVSKPTIKFSIQKSHDLKISFKVLNNSNEYSDEEMGSREAEVKGNGGQDSNNSTELITLKYKSIQRDGDRNQNLDLKRRRRTFRRKKQKTPVLKFKKSRYSTQEERDPLADDSEPSAVPDEYSTPDGFQVKETVDSAKIKLTFKRHKGNFETEYKINSNNLEKVPELDPLRQEHDRKLEATKTRWRKKSRTRKKEIFAESDVEIFQDRQETRADADSGPEKVFLETSLEDSRNSLMSEDSYTERQNFELESALSTFEFPSNTLPENSLSPSGEKEMRYIIEDSKCNKETNKCLSERGEFPANHLINCDNGSEGERHEFSRSDYNSFPDGNTKESTRKETGSQEKDVEEAAEYGEEKIQEISPVFIESTKSQKIETNHKSRKTEEIESVENGTETVEGENRGLKNLEKAQEPTAKGGEDIGKTFVLEILEVPGTWDVGPEGSVDMCKRDELRTEASAPVETATAINFEYEDEKGKGITPDDRDEAENNEAATGQSNKVELLLSEKRTEFQPHEKDANRGRENTSQGDDGGRALEFDLNVTNTTANLAKQDSESHFPNPENASLRSEHCFKELLVAEEGVENVAAQEQQESCSVLRKCSEHPEQEGDFLKFDGETQSDCVDVAEPESFEIAEDSSQGNGLFSFSPTKKIVFESREISFQEYLFSKEEDGTKDGDNKVGVACDSFLSSKEPNDADQFDSAADKRSREKRKADELAEPKIGFTDRRLSPTGCDLEKDSGCAECSFSPVRTTEDERGVSVAVDSCLAQVDLASELDPELEEGEIVDSSDELTGYFNDTNPQGPLEKSADILKRIGFTGGEVERLHSTDPNKRTKTPELQTWARRKFSKTRSCPPEINYAAGRLGKEEPNFSVEDIPLPVGPPPLHSCFNFEKCSDSSECTEAKKERRESISIEGRPANQTEISREGSQPSYHSPFVMNGLQDCRNTSPRIFDREPSCSLGLLQRSSKIKFSFSKRSKFSKVNLNVTNDSKLETAFDIQSNEVRDESGKREFECPCFEKDKKVRTSELEESSSLSKVCDTKEVGNAPDGKEEKDQEDIKLSSDSKRPVEFFGESLDESIEAMPDFIRDELYECEGLPMSEDLANGDDLEIEKVNDDKFRNIMQNCLDNAKKFLNIGNLKLFSSSVDDLLELDSRTTSGESESEKSNNHIVRDVLLTSCDDANDDLGLPDDDQFANVAVDFGPSLSSDVCPEILPVDNWPYLEEEVASSPTPSKEDETDFIPTLKHPLSVTPQDQLYQDPIPFNETGFTSHRRRSVISGEEALKLCSKIGVRRRNTIDCFRSFGKTFCGIKREIMGLKREPNDFETSQKCRSSLKKLSKECNLDCGLKNGKMGKFSEELANEVKVRRAERLDYKSPSWQPKVMLFRISKNELRKVLKNSKPYKRFKSKTSEKSQEAESSGHIEGEVLKKRKSDASNEKGYLHPEEEMKKVAKTLDSGSDETFVSLKPLSSSFIKGSIMSRDPYKKKRSRFRNLHTKRRSDCGTGHSSTKQTETPDVAEALLTEMFKDCDKLSHSKTDHPKEMVTDEEKPKKQQKDKPKNPSPSNDKRLEKDPKVSHSSGKLKGEPKENRHREKSDKSHDRRNRREKRKEGGEHHKQRDKHGERRDGHGSSHDRSSHQGREFSVGTRGGRGEPEQKEAESCRRANEEEGKKSKILKEVSLEVPWLCEVCGFSDAAERVVHIKSHPFHCQSCHLAFKTETHFIDHLNKKHKDIRNQHHCLLCELSFDTEEEYQKHLYTREHRHLEAVEKNTINTLFTLLTGAPCPVLGIAEMKPEWLPNQAGTVHFYHQATPLSLALQYLKMRHDLSSLSSASSAHPS